MPGPYCNCEDYPCCGCEADGDPRSDQDIKEAVYAAMEDELDSDPYGEW